MNRSARGALASEEHGLMSPAREQQTGRADFRHGAFCISSGSVHGLSQCVDSRGRAGCCGSEFGFEIILLISELLPKIQNVSQ